MSASQLTKTRIRAGTWEGVLTLEQDAPAPDLEVVHLDQPLPGLVVQPDAEIAGLYSVQVPIPAALLSDGVQVFVIRDKASGARLAHFTILTDEIPEGELIAEVELLRAELDMLKKAFRRHCVETM